MPTVLRLAGYRFYFYSHEPNEPPHVHVDKGGASAKLWLQPAGLARNIGFRAREIGTITTMVRDHREQLIRLGMGILAVSADERIAGVSFDTDRLVVDLMHGRTIAVPLAWYPRLFDATAEQRTGWEIAGGGYGLHWSELDEDLSVEGLLRGAPAARAA